MARLAPDCFHVTNCTPASSAYSARPLRVIELQPGQLFCFGACLQRHLGLTPSGLNMTLTRHFSDLRETVLQVRRAEPLFPKLIATYVAVMGGESLCMTEHARADKLNVFPLDLVAKVLRFHVEHRLPKGCPQTLATLSEFLPRPSGVADVAVPAPLDSVPCDQRAEGKDDKDDSAAIVRDGKDEKTAVQTLAPSEQNELAEGSAEETVEELIDYFVSAPESAADCKASERVLGSYGLKAEEIGPTLRQQAQAFSAFRQEIWNFHRDPNQVGAATVANNLKVLFLFGGHVCSKHRMARQMFDFAVFDSTQFEEYLLGFLKHLRESRGLQFSTLANYVNALVMCCKFHFANSEGAEQQRQFVLEGLRRIRSQTNAQAKQENVQKDVSASKKWITWQQAQLVRQKALAALDFPSQSAEQDSRALQRTVLLLLYTIAPPPRCSIVRLLEWGSTLVKSTTDSKRYVIDLKSHPDAPAAKHKTVKYHRRSVLPLPVMITGYLDELHAHHKSGFVFVNSKGKSYSATSWSKYVQTSVRKFAPAADSEGCGGSLLRSVFVTWLNGLAYVDDRSFLEEMKLSAAAYQTHSLAIANSLYDRGGVSYERLVKLVDFCEAYAARSTSSDLQPSAKPMPSTPGAFLSPAPLPALPQESDSQETKETKARPPPRIADLSLGLSVLLEHGMALASGSVETSNGSDFHEENEETKTPSPPRDAEPQPVLSVLLEHGHSAQPARRPLAPRKRARRSSLTDDEQSAAVKRQLRKLGIAMNVVTINGRL